MNHTFKCILADVDGTLVNEGRVMGELTKQVLGHLQKKGIYLGIASGRPLDELPMTTASFDADLLWDFLIGMNGGEVYDGLTDKTSVIYQMQPDIIREALLQFWDFDSVTPTIYRGHALMATQWTELLEVSKKHAHKEAIVTRNLEDFCSKPTGKIMLRTITPEQCDEIEAYAKAHPSPDYAAFKTQPTLLELQDPRVNKGAALRKICQDHGWSPKDIIALGDASNDNEMLKAAGIGVCLCNGLEDTKACADVLTDYDNEKDGAARWLLKAYPELFEDMDYEIPDPDHGYFAPSKMPNLADAQKAALAHQQEMEKQG